MADQQFRTDAREIPYFADDGHALLGFDAVVLPGASRHDRPLEALTLAVLPGCDLAQLARMVQALAANMPRFSGELILPAPEADETQQAALAASLKAWGVASRELDVAHPLAYRNTVAESAEREWVLFLDARMSLQWNPLQIAEKEIVATGAPVVNLPRVSRDGRYVSIDHLGFERNSAGLSILARAHVRGTMGARGLQGPALCSGIDSASLLIRRDVLRDIGAFGNASDVPAADVGLATRLFRRGIKVIVSEAVAIYDDELASPGESAQPLGGTQEPISIPEVVVIDPLTIPEGAERPKVALVVDVYNWAFGNISRQVKRYLSDRYDFRIIPIGDLGSLLRVLMLTEDCRIVHFFWREEILQIGTPHYRQAAQALGMGWEAFEARFIAGKLITTSIYDHLMQDAVSMSARSEAYARLPGYTVANQKLLRFYGNPPVSFPAPTCTTEDGVDLTLFRPVRLERFASADHRDLIVGWVGNSAWEGKTEDFKGLHTILRLAVDELRAEGYAIRLELADRQQGFTPHEEMPRYYSKIDVLACSSKIEGTPNPVLEAMACGVPVVSTDVGIVPEVFGKRQRDFILDERSKDCMKAKLKSMVGQAALLQALSAENLETIRGWDWSIKAENFHRFFSAVLGRGQG